MQDAIFNDSTFDFYDRKFEADSSHSASQIGRYVILYLRQGSLKVSVDSKVYELKEKEFLFLPKGTKKIRYYFIASPIHTSVSLGFRYFPDATPYDFPVQIIKASDLLSALVEEVPLDGVASCSTTWKFYRFLYEFKNHLVPHNKKNYFKIEKAIEYMYSNDNYDVPFLARLCGMSETRFYVAFQEITNSTPIAFKQRLLAYKTEILLRTTDLSIEQISAKLGFKSIRYFRANFKKYYKYPPNHFRKKNKG